MVAIRIEERAQDAFNAVVSVNGSGEYPAKVADPFSSEEEARLEWYFEEHLRFPTCVREQLSDCRAVRPARGVRSVTWVPDLAA